MKIKILRNSAELQAQQTLHETKLYLKWNNTGQTVGLQNECSELFSWGWNISFSSLCRDRGQSITTMMYQRCDAEAEASNIWINIFLSHETCETWHLSLCLNGQRHIAGTSSCPITTFIKISSGIHSKDAGEFLSHLSIFTILRLLLPPPLSVLVASAGWWMTLPSRDSAGSIITEQVLAWSPTVPSQRIDLGCCLTLTS